MIMKGGCAAALWLAASLAAADFGGIPSGTYALDEDHAFIVARYTHMGFSRPHLRFAEFDVDLEIDSEEPTASRLVVRIDPASVDSGVPRFDEHLRSEDFFDVERYPSIRFESTQIRMTGDNTAEITGDLTIKGVTRPVTLLAELNRAGTHPVAKAPWAGFSATTTVKRSAFDLGLYVPMVSDEVALDIQAEFGLAE